MIFQFYYIYFCQALKVFRAASLHQPFSHLFKTYAICRLGEAPSFLSGIDKVLLLDIIRLYQIRGGG
jgi:hypothetical protein